MYQMINVLFLTSSPENIPHVRGDEEFNQVDTILASSEYGKKFNLTFRAAVSLDKLQELFYRFQPNVVHFSGHGSTLGKLMFYNREKDSEYASQEALTKLFKKHNDDIHCVVLSACYAKDQARQISQHIDCVIGMSNTISRKAAIAFAKGFYLSLGFGKSVQEAFNTGKIQIEMEGSTGFKVPKLLHSREVNPNKIFLKSKRESHKENQLNKTVLIENHEIIGGDRANIVKEAKLSKGSGLTLKNNKVKSKHNATAIDKLHL
jgi:hypothetical protein